MCLATQHGILGSPPYPSFGTNARNRRGLSTRIFWIVSSGTPAYRSFGAKTVTTEEYPAPPFALSSCSAAKSADRSTWSSSPASMTDTIIATFFASPCVI